MGVEILNLEEAISDIQFALVHLGIAKLKRAYCKVGKDLIPTGDVQWQVEDEKRLKRSLVSAVGKERAISIGQEVSKTTDGLKVYRMIEQLQSAEVLALQDVLKDLITLNERR